MKRGEIWTVSGSGYAGKPRPAVIIQHDRFDTTYSVTVCPITTNPAEASDVRLPIDPTAQNGLQTASRLMIDKITTVPRSKVGRRVGRLSDDEMARIGRAVIVFLGLTTSGSR